MAKQKMNPSNGVYDPDDHVPVDKPQLSKLENTNHKPPQEENEGLYNPGGGKEDDKTASNKDLNDAEGSSDKVGKGFSAVPSIAGTAGIGGVLSSIIKNPKNRKRALFGGGGIAGILTLVIISFFMLIPLKIESIVTNLQNRFFATATNAVQKETDTMIENYFKGPLADAMRLKHTTCSKEGTVVISRNCTLNFTGQSTNNPVINLYRTYSQNKLETELADKYGIELKYDTSGKGTYYLKAPGINGEAKVGDGVNGIDSEFDAVDKGTVRQAFRDAEKNLTGWDKVMFRFKVGKLLEQKYGIKRCIVYCGQRDALSNSDQNKKYAAKLFLIERVIAPHNAALAAIMGCILNTSSTACQSPAPTTCADGSDCNELAGEPMTGADADVEKAVGEATADLGSETAKQLLTTIGEIKDAGGASNWALQKLISQIIGQDFADKTIPVIGQLQMINQIAGFVALIGKAPAVIKDYSYLANASAAVSLYMMYRTYADEIHTGHVDPTEVGSFNNSLGPGSQCDPKLEGSCGAQAGGTADATNTPLYNYLINGQTGSSSTSASSTSFLSNIFPSAYADSGQASSTSNTYTCHGGGGVPSGSLVCPEEKLGQSNKAVTTVSNAFNNTGLVGPAEAFHTVWSNPLNPFNWVSNLAGFFGSGVISFAESFGPLKGIINEVKNLAGNFIEFLTHQLIPSAITPDMSGGRTFDMMAAGADVAGNDYAHTGIGGHLLSNQTVAGIVAEQDNQEKQQLSQQGIFARLFSTNNTYSLISKVALDMPFNIQSAGSSLASLISDPFTGLFSSFSSLFSGHANAAVAPVPDPFGVNQYGYSQEDLNSIGDPSVYWDKYCSNNPSQAYQSDQYASNPNTNWNDQAANYPGTNGSSDPSGRPININDNPCLLIEATVGSAGGMFNTSLLTQDEQTDLSSGSSASTSSNTPGSCSGGGKYAALVGPGSTYADTDQGIDFIPTSNGTAYNICAPASGTITQADQTGHQFQRTPGQAEVIEKLDQTPNAPNSSRYIYYAELVNINSQLHVGSHVNAGDLIGTNSQSPGIEAGWGLNSTIGFLCPIGNPVGQPTACGNSFNSWVQSVSSGATP